MTDTPQESQDQFRDLGFGSVVARFSLASIRCQRWAMGTWSRSRSRPTP